MAPTRRSGVTGDRELVAALRALASEGMSTSDVDAAATKSLQPMLKDTKERIRVNRNYAGKYPGFPDPASPRKGGHVDEGIVIKKDDATNKNKRSYKLGPTKRARPLMHLLEFGTAPHFQPNFKGGFMHPGATPKPAMSPAFEENKDAVSAVFGQEIWSRLSAKMSKLNTKAPKRR